MSQWINVDDYLPERGKIDEICYKKNFLTEVIVRIDFVSRMDDICNNLPKSLSKEILKHFPIPILTPLEHFINRLERV